MLAVTEGVFCTVTVRGNPLQKNRAEEGGFEKCDGGHPSFFARNSDGGDLLHEMRD